MMHVAKQGRIAATAVAAAIGVACTPPPPEPTTPAFHSPSICTFEADWAEAQPTWSETALVLVIKSWEVGYTSRRFALRALQDGSVVVELNGEWRSGRMPMPMLARWMARAGDLARLPPVADLQVHWWSSHAPMTEVVVRVGDGWLARRVVGAGMDDLQEVAANPELATAPENLNAKVDEPVESDADGMPMLKPHAAPPLVIAELFAEAFRCGTASATRSDAGAP